MSSAENSGPGYAKHPEHTVVVEPFRGHVRVEAGGEVLADSVEALQLNEGSYPPVYYVPRKDVRMDRLASTDHHTYCPFKGEASYFSIVDGADNALWSYEKPYDEVSSIARYVAFYPSKVDSIQVEAAGRE
jgi:uncharacterized protein (DUF427 family)